MPFTLTYSGFSQALAQSKGWKLSWSLSVALSLGLILPSNECWASAYGAGASASFAVADANSFSGSAGASASSALGGSNTGFFDSSSMPTLGPKGNRAHSLNQYLGKRDASLYGYTKVASISASANEFSSSSSSSSNEAGSAKKSSSPDASANVTGANATSANAAGVGSAASAAATEATGANAATNEGADAAGNKVPLLDEGADQAFASCISSFNETRQRVLQANTQSVILHSNSNGIAPFIMLQIAAESGSHYVLWQNLNGDIRGYALRDGKGFDYANNANTPLPLSWHPTLIWDNLFGAEQKLKNYSCVLTGRTRVMGKRVSLLRFIPQEGLRYSLLLAKEDESDFPVELSLLDPKGGLVSRLTVMDSRIIVGVDFPLADTVFDRVERSQQEGRLGHENILLHQDSGTKTADDVMAGTINSGTGTSAAGGALASAFGDGNQNNGRDPSLPSHLPSPTVNAGATVPAMAATNGSTLGNTGIGFGDGSNVWAQAPSTSVSVSNAALKPWPELNIPDVYTMIASGPFLPGGNQCFYQEFSDGLTSFRVYRNQRSTSFYPALSNGSISCVRKNTLHHEYAVVGEVPVALAEFVLAKIVD